MNKILFNLTYSRNVAGMVKGPVKCMRVQDALGWQGVVPDRDAIEACLPASYRKAWKRCKTVSRFAGKGDNVFYYTLRDSRGKYLNTVYATGYVLEV